MDHTGLKGGALAETSTGTGTYLSDLPFIDQFILNCGVLFKGRIQKISVTLLEETESMWGALNTNISIISYFFVSQ